MDIGLFLYLWTPKFFVSVLLINVIEAIVAQIDENANNYCRAKTLMYLSGFVVFITIFVLKMGR